MPYVFDAVKKEVLRRNIFEKGIRVDGQGLNQENSGCLHSPGALTPVRLKRPRPDSVHSQPSWLDDSPLDQDLEIVPLAETPSMVEDTTTSSTDIKTQLAQLSAIPPSS